MRATRWLAMVAVVVSGTALLAVEQVGVRGSSTSYPAEVEASVAGRTVKMVLTGTGLRSKAFFNIYTIGSYVQQGTEVKSAEALAAVDQPKRLHLVMERTVDGKDLAEAFRAAIRLNHPEPAFTEEINTLSRFMRGTSVRQGDHILLTHVPGIGMHCSMGGKVDFFIKNPHFSQAVWNIYLGPKNVGEEIKKGLVSRL